MPFRAPPAATRGVVPVVMPGLVPVLVPVLALALALVATLAGFAPLAAEVGSLSPADTVAAGEPRLPDTVVDGVRGEIGAAWGVDPARVILRWTLPSALADASPEAFRVLGTGAGGQWIVELRMADGIQRLSLRAGVVVPVWVAARELPRDHILADGDLVQGFEPRWGPPPADAGRNAPAAAPAPPHLGWRVQRRIEAGDVVSPPAVAPPSLFQAGDAVAVQVQRGQVSLEIVGEARSAGVQGGEARVRLPSGRVVTGTVVSATRITLKEGS